jgi:hypothetical protein
MRSPSAALSASVLDSSPLKISLDGDHLDSGHETGNPLAILASHKGEKLDLFERSEKRRPKLDHESI